MKYGTFFFMSWRGGFLSCMTHVRIRSEGPDTLGDAGKGLGTRRQKGGRGKPRTLLLGTPSSNKELRIRVSVGSVVT